MPFEILSARRVPSGALVKKEGEVVDTAETVEDARRLQKEYAIAFGDLVGVWVRDPEGSDLDIALSRHNCIRPGCEVI